MSELIDHIRQSVVGARIPIKTPFGLKPLVYADYTASGRSLSFIEDYIRYHVLPCYANTHTESTFSGAQTTALREQARQEIRKAVNGTDEDMVIFCGSGATSAVDKLVDILGLRIPRDLDDRYQLLERIPEDERPVVFVGPYEHHSNELPWRETIAQVVQIPLASDGQLCVRTLQQELARYALRPMKIVSFAAASTVTRLKSDLIAITRTLKENGALSFWDYAAAGPYVGIDLNSDWP
ncbi:MAG: aminotransferase class V-fold PLP-dependent enzyme, partial [Pseudomonadota bacterium]